MTKLGVVALLTAGLLISLLWTATTIQAAVSPGFSLDPQDATWTDFFPGGWSNLLPLESGITAGDPQGLDPSSAAYRTSTNGGTTWTAWTIVNLVATPVNANTVDLVVSGLSLPESASQNLIQFQIRNRAGILQTSSTHRIQVDTTAPGAPFNLNSSPEDWTNINQFGESWSNPADLSGIVGTYYKLDRQPSYATDGTYRETTNSLSGVTVSGEGKHTIYIWLVDAAGNVNHANRNVDVDAFLYDISDPSVGVQLDGPQGQNGWYTDAVVATFDPQDGLSGVASWGWELDGGLNGDTMTTTVEGDLVHALVVTATDVAGNIADPSVISVAIDGGPPILTYSLTAGADLKPADSGWYTAPLTVTFELTDEVSGPDAITWQLDEQPEVEGSQVVLTEDGDHRLAARGADVAGNPSSELVLNLSVDTRSPTTTLTLTPAVAPSGYYTALVIGELEAIDKVSGVAATWLQIDGNPWQEASSFGLEDNGYYHLGYYSVDVAGNLEISHTRAISLDLVPPAAPPTATLEPQDWTANNSFRLWWENPPDTSGISGTHLFLGDGPPQAGDGEFFPAEDPAAPTGEIEDLTVPGEGEWPVWMWLQDVAGNAEPDNARLAAFARYDATPPQVDLEADGPGGNDDWFVGPVTVTLSITDAGSGPDFLRYRVDGDPWQESSAYTVELQIDTPGKHVVDYFGQDVAGAISGPNVGTIRVDPDPPTSPIAVAAEPETWTNLNEFVVTWRNPMDASGVTTAYVSLAPPSDSRDGETHPADDLALTLAVPEEGSFDLYLWLEDVAGNVDMGQAVHLPDALRFDVTPPETTPVFSIEPNADDWFRSDVGVTFSAEDTLSGVVMTIWQLDGKPPSSQSWLFVEGDGTHSLLVHSTDHAGNVEDTAEYVIKIDATPPTVRLLPLSNYSAGTDISVAWEGSDGEPTGLKGYVPGSSGIGGYNVDVRTSASGDWERWLSNTTKTQATFKGERGRVYAFRVQAMDKAGNQSGWSQAGGRNIVLVDPVVNGRFESRNFEGWITQDTLGLDLIQEVDLQPGSLLPAARLGSTRWLACAELGNLPTLLCGDDWSGIGQTIVVPGPEEMPHPTLSLWYRVQTYDQMFTQSPYWGQACPDLPGPPYTVDTFEVAVTVAGSGQPTMVLRDGNEEPQITTPDPNPPIPFRDLGWRPATIDMTPFAGQTIRIDLSNHNRLDARFNTWTDVYNVRLHGDQERVFLPLIAQEAPTVPTDPVICYPRGGNIVEADQLQSISPDLSRGGVR